MIRFKRGLLTLFLIFAALPLASQTGRTPVRNVWIDADTGNDIDDVFAIVRLLAEADISVLGLSSVHFNNPDLLVYDRWNRYATEDLSTVGVSQELNRRILAAMQREGVPAPVGADRQVGRSWGGSEPRPSPAAEALAACAAALPEGEKLDVLCLGAVTNLVSAVLLHPEILPRIRCYVLAAQYDAGRGVWNKNEFNVRNDLNAFDCLLSEERLEVYLMPVNVSESLVFRERDVFGRLDPSCPAHRLIREVWAEMEDAAPERALWDLALVEAFLHPELARLESRPVPPENGEHRIFVYTRFDAGRGAEDFWKSMENFIESWRSTHPRRR